MICFTILYFISFCFCKVTERLKDFYLKSKLFPNFIFKDVVKNNHLGTGEDLPDRREYTPLESGFDIFPYVKVSLILILMKIEKYLKTKVYLTSIFCNLLIFWKFVSFSFNFSFSICWTQSLSCMTIQICWCQVSWRFGITMLSWISPMTSPWRHLEQTDNSKASEKVNYLPVHEHPEQHSLNFFWKSIDSNFH